jgi:hypothetical protein
LTLDPGTCANRRHRQLQGSSRSAPSRGDAFPRWQIEVTSGGRIWYLPGIGRDTVRGKHAGQYRGQALREARRPAGLGSCRAMGTVGGDIRPAMYAG